MEGLQRHPIYYMAIGYSLYGVGGTVLAFNLHATARAYATGSVPLVLAYALAGLYSLISIGVGLYLSNPREWGVLWASFVATAKGANEGSAPRWLTSGLLAGMVVLILGFLMVCYWADWQTTYDYLLGMGVSSLYLLGACLALILGPEVAFLCAHVVLQQGKRAELIYLTGEQAIRPNLAYLRGVIQGKVKTAEAAATADSGQHQHR